jgi:hypothetical protein
VAASTLAIRSESTVIGKPSVRKGCLAVGGGVSAGESSGALGGYLYEVVGLRPRFSSIRAPPGQISQGQPMASDWVPSVLGGLSGAITGGAISLIISLGVEAWQRRLYGPKLELHCEARDHRAPIGWLDESNKRIGEVIYVRMRVRNVKPRIAKSCRAYLTKVERLKPDGKTWENTIFGEGIQLAWLGKARVTVSMPLAFQRASINLLMSWRWESYYL